MFWFSDHEEILYQQNALMNEVIYHDQTIE